MEPGGRVSYKWEAVGGSLERRDKHRSQSQQETLVPAAGRLICASRPSSSARRASSGAQPSRRQRRQPVSGVR